jgi:hypothetical protein
MHRSLLTAIAIAALATPSFAANNKSSRVSNNIKYKDSAPYRRAATGDASIQTRALLGRDGTTTIEITTGQLDVANSATGTLEKVQLKVSGKNGWTKNYNNAKSTGTFILPVTGLTRGTTIQIHANVRTSRNVQVLQVTDTVRLRPDLQVAAIGVPASVTAGVPVSVTATVRELNGDTGARATCALTVDGKQADSASNIWVDAGGNVQCLFTTTFAAGTHSLSVTAGNVVPGDWDTRNNTASASVTAATTNRNIWSSTATQTTLREKYVTSYSDRPADKTDLLDKTSITDILTFNGTLPYMLNLDNVWLNYTERTDGQQIITFNTWVELPSSSTCRSDTGRNQVITVCNTADGKATLNVTRRGSEVTYLSRGWLARYSGGQQVGWDQYIMDEHQTQGAMPRYGNTVSVDISLTDGNRTWTADPFMNLTPYENPAESSRTCRVDANGVTICTDTFKQTTGKKGADESF